MKGFIKNETNRAIFKLQRPIPVNGDLSFDNAYLSVGESSGKKEGLAFIKWLKETHFPDEGWVFYKEEGVLFFKKDATANVEPKPEIKEETKIGSKDPEVVIPEAKIRKKEPARGAGKKLTRKKSANEKKRIDASTIVAASIEDAKDLINKTKDKGILKRALTLTSHFSKKEEHRRAVMKRLDEVY